MCSPRRQSRRHSRRKRPSTRRAPFAVVGIGVNVNHEADDFPAELAAIARSLRIATGRAFDRTALAVAILRGLDARYSSLRSDFPELVAEASRRSVLLGKWITVDTGTSLVEGVATNLTADGQLLLRDSSGEIRTLTAGEVSLVPR